MELSIAMSSPRISSLARTATSRFSISESRRSRTRKPSSPETKRLQEIVSDPHQLTATGSAIGTLDYMSPEQVRGEPLDSRSDLFSLGALLYEMAAGIPPFRGETRAEIYDAILHKNPKPSGRSIALYRRSWNRSSASACKRTASARYQQVAEIQADLERLRRRTDWLRRLRRARAGLGLAAASVCLAMAAYLVLRPPPAPRVSGYVQLTDDGQGKGAPEGAMVTDGARLYFGEGSGMCDRHRSGLCVRWRDISTARGPSRRIPNPRYLPKPHRAAGFQLHGLFARVWVAALG